MDENTFTMTEVVLALKKMTSSQLENIRKITEGLLAEADIRKNDW